MRQVILTRSPAECAQTAARLHSMGFDPLIAPLFDIKPVPHRVPEHDFKAVIATSRHALLTLEPHIRDRLRQIPLYVVGPATAETARALGFTAIRPGPGDAAGLAQIIVQEQSETEQMLFLTGEPRKPDLEAALGPRFALTLCSLYRSIPRDAFPRDVLAKITDPAPIWLHFSQKSAERAAKLIKNTGFEAFFAKGLHIALAPAITETLKNAGVAQCLTAKEPTQTALLEALGTI